eukprot:8810328-Ditylum_brightwellii.AAC.1
MMWYEYMHIPIILIPDKIIEQYTLKEKVSNGHVYVNIRKGMYGLPQEGCIAHDQLKQQLAKHGYKPCKFKPGLWRHEKRNITFCLVVDAFGIKYTKKSDVTHPIPVLKKLYTITIDWQGYIAAALHKFKHNPPEKPKYAPHEAIEHVYK